jgi:hypothetical protein
VKDVRVDAFPSSLIYYLGFNTQSPQQPALANPALWLQNRPGFVQIVMERRAGNRAIKALRQEALMNAVLPRRALMARLPARRSITI